MACREWLLPGPRDRDGLPDSIRFWKNRIEEPDPDKTFAVGLIYGPSGCGKSSLMKAGLLPRLADSIIAVYVEATAEDIEPRLLRGLRKHCPDLPDGLDLSEILAALRRGVPCGKKVVIVLDQFEQWLHAKREEENTELVQALRQCNGEHVQCIVMVRDDFWMAATRFMQELEIRLVEGHNSTAVDLFDLRHAKKVLTAFGRAFGAFSEEVGELTSEQAFFLKQTTSGLAQEGKVVCVRLALFAEMVKGKPWIPATLDSVGGTEGVGVTFLEETFSSRAAPPEHRLHQKAARAVLKALLPETGTNIRGSMRSEADVLAASGYAERPRDFDALMRILDRETRLLTPVDPEGALEDDNQAPPIEAGEKYYQLTHDYLFPALRQWLTRKQRETRRGRAELWLPERAALWRAKLENRHLPSCWEYLNIRLLTDKKDWTELQRRMVKRAGRVYGIRWGSALAAMLVIGFTVWHLVSTERRRSLRKQISAAVSTLQISRGRDVPDAIDALRGLPLEIVRKELRSKFSDITEENRRVPLACALAEFGQVEYELLVSSIADARPDECPNIVSALRGAENHAISALRQKAQRPEKTKDWRYKARLAIVALYLGDTSIAHDMFQLRPDPIQRTWLIDTFASWRSDLAAVRRLAEENDDVAFRSGICLGVGSVPEGQLANEERLAWEPLLIKWYREAGDTATHSAAGWALRQWQVKSPEIRTSGKPTEGRNWFVNSLDMTLLKIPAGHFVRSIGVDRRNVSAAGHFARSVRKNQKAQRVILSRAFFLSDREVSIDQFKRFLTADEADKPLKPPDADDEASQKGSWPVQGVNWSDVILFCNWLSRSEDRRLCYERIKAKQYGNVTWRIVPDANGYRLPTEAEWEHACRAETVTSYAWGDNESFLDKYAVFRVSRPERGASKLPNGSGLFDMQGNVWEWCHDWYGEYGTANELVDPRGPREGDYRVLRGGGSDGVATQCSSANRSLGRPSERGTDFGFRLLLCFDGQDFLRNPK